MKNKLASYIGAAFTVALAAPATAATIISATGVTGNVIAQNTTGGGAITPPTYIVSRYVAGDNHYGSYIALAQSFTTGTLGLNNQMDAVYVRTTANSFVQGGNLNFYFYKVDGTYDAGDGTKYTVSNVVNESGSWNQALGAQQLTESKWIKITLSTTITLSDNTKYGFALNSVGVGSNANSGAFFEWDVAAADQLSGGQAHSAGVGGFNTADIWLGSKVSGNYSEAAASDRVFAITTIPEPSAALLGGLGMLVMLRRRRG